MRERPDTRPIVSDMREQGLKGVVNMEQLIAYCGRSRNWVKKRFGDMPNGISVVTAARILAGLEKDGS